MANDLRLAASKAIAVMERIWDTHGHDDEWIYDEMGSELATAYFNLRDALDKPE